MQRHFYTTLLFAATFGFINCKKETADNFSDVFSQPYTTGIIKFQYQVPATNNGLSTVKDTIVNFTSIGNNISEKDDYGFFKSSTEWVQLSRLNPNNFQNRAFIFFAGTNLNALTLPYKFKAGDNQNAQINYVISSGISLRYIRQSSRCIGHICCKHFF